MEKELESLGLSKNESTIYLFLLKHGESSSGPIIKETGIANSRVYESLNSLITKSLVTYRMNKNGKSFQASDPAKLVEDQEEKLKHITSIIPQLKNLQNTQENDFSTSIYEGFKGFKTAFEKIIRDCPEKGVISILGFSEQIYNNESLRLFLSNMNIKSSDKKQQLNIILDRDSKETLGKDREHEKHTEIRYMPKGYISPAAIDIFEDWVYIFLWEESPYVFSIKNQMVADSFKQYFNFLWKIAKK